MRLLALQAAARTAKLLFREWNTLDTPEGIGAFTALSELSLWLTPSHVTNHQVSFETVEPLVYPDSVVLHDCGLTHATCPFLQTPFLQTWDDDPNATATVHYPLRVPSSA